MPTIHSPVIDSFTQTILHEILKYSANELWGAFAFAPPDILCVELELIHPPVPVGEPTVHDNQCMATQAGDTSRSEGGAHSTLKPGSHLSDWNRLHGQGC